VKTPSYAHSAKNAAEYTDDLSESTGVVFYGAAGQTPQFAWAVARLGCPCWSCDVSLDVLCKITVTDGVPTISVVGEPDWDSGSHLLAMVDLDVTGDFHEVVFEELSGFYFSHPKLGARTLETTAPPNEVTEPRAP
jgi:hypothetical protein